ncbi:MAG: hypothetical protein HRT71_21000 [Flavobacteriales bacterium]|nr:hypothetical protein [Flavobacteriales bacterium]
MFVAILLLGVFFSGLFKVPLNGWIQEKVTGRKLGDILALNNMMVFIFILLASIAFEFLVSTFDSNAVFVMISVAAWAMSIVTLFKIPTILNKAKRLKIRTEEAVNVSHFCTVEIFSDCDACDMKNFTYQPFCAHCGTRLGEDVITEFK